MRDATTSLPINETLHDGPAIGLDWFLLDLLDVDRVGADVEIGHKQLSAFSRRLAVKNAAAPFDLRAAQYVITSVIPTNTRNATIAKAKIIDMIVDQAPDGL